MTKGDFDEDGNWKSRPLSRRQGLRRQRSMWLCCWGSRRRRLLPLGWQRTFFCQFFLLLETVYVTLVGKDELIHVLGGHHHRDLCWWQLIACVHSQNPTTSTPLQHSQSGWKERPDTWEKTVSLAVEISIMMKGNLDKDRNKQTWISDQWHLTYSSLKNTC